MKYIRTKDGRIIDTKGKELVNPRVVQFYDDDLKNAMWVDDIIAQADTVEELCDEFVGIYKNICEVVIDKTNWNKYDIFYGAIWTDKGLIYVAKMNEKGVLELL